MSRYEKPVWMMIYEVIDGLPEVFTPVDVIRRVKEKYPEVKESTLRAHVIALTLNHPSSKHYSLKHRFFYYLGNGRYRLLKPEERTLPPLPSKYKEPPKKYGRFSSQLDKAEKLLSQGFYPESISEYGRILEELFKQLYQEYLPRLPYLDKEKAIIYEKEKGKPIDKFTIGEWLGLFQHANLFNFISQDKKGKGKGLIFFNPHIINIIKTLRNMAVHPESDKENYVNRETALFMRSTIQCILHELRI